MPELNRVTQSFVLDFRRPAVNRLKLVNGDTANTFVITLKNGGNAVSLNTDLHKVIAVFRRADGHVYTQDASTGVSFTTTGVVTIDVRPASFRSGTNTVELQVYKRESNDATTYPLLATTYPQAFTARNETLTGEGENAPSQLPMLEQIIHDAGEATTAANNAAAAANAAAALYPGIYMLPYETSEWIDGTDGAAYDYQTELSITTEEYLALLEDKPDVVLGVRVTLPSGKEVTLIENNRRGAPNTTDVDFKADDVVDGYFVTATLEENWNVALIVKLWTAEHYVDYNDLVAEMAGASRNLNHLPVGRYKSEQALPEAVANPTTMIKYVGLTDVLAVQARTKYTVKFYNLSPMTGDITVSFYDSSKQYISHSFSSGVGKTYSFTTPVNCAYIHIWKYTSNMWGNIKNTRVMLEYGTGTDYDYGYVGPQTLIDDTARVAASEAQKKANALGTRVSTLEGNEPLVLHVASVTPSQTSVEKGSLTFASGETDEIYANALTRDMEFDFAAPWENTMSSTIRMKKSQVLIDATAQRVITFVGYNVYHTNAHGMWFYPVAINVYYLEDGTYFRTIYVRLPDYTSTIPVAASVSENRVSFKNSDGTTLFYFDLPVGG